MNIIDKISKKGSDKEKIAKEVIKSPEFISQLLEGLNNSKGSIRLGCEKILRLISEQQPELIFKKYFASITDKTMITASNTIKNSWKIALAKPEFTEKISQEILKAEKARYENKGQLSPECNNIVCGHAIDSFDKFFNEIRDKKPVLGFIKRQLSNNRKPVAKKADKFLKKYNISL